MPSKSNRSVRSGKARQYGVIPYRVAADGVHVLLITSRETRRWVIPKGNPMKGCKPHKAAAIEAFEEAGVKGKVEREALGSFGYDKSVGRKSVPCVVSVFPMHVRQELDAWPESGQRERTWVKREAAAGMVREPELADLLRSFDPGSSGAA
jgi:8-oxo-dGTP pyrophosphatase MutT (NUDIX family)